LKYDRQVQKNLPVGVKLNCQEKNTQVNPTIKTTSYQLVLPLNVEMLIPENDFLIFA